MVETQHKVLKVCRTCRKTYLVTKTVTTDSYGRVKVTLEKRVCPHCSHGGKYEGY